MMRSLAQIMLLTTALCAPGCEGNGDANRAAPLEAAPNRQVQTGSSVDQRRSTLADRPGALQYDNARADAARAAAPNGSDPKQPQSPGVSEAVRQAVKSPQDEAVARAGLGSSASTLPVPRNPASQQGAGVGTALTLGTVVAEVNGRPIFANKLLQTIAPVLAAKAKELDERRFRAAAAKEIGDQLSTLIKDELTYAAAQRNLDADEKRMAQILTERDRDDMIRKAGGSLQVARQSALAQGLDLDQVLEDRSRVNLFRVYMQRKEYPRIQITADDMRRYYQLHLNDIFTERAQAQFRVIKVDFKRTGGRDKAMEKARELQSRAARGEDFAAIAGAINDDPFLMQKKGDVTGGGGWMDQGAYANQKVEAAVWALRPGDVTDVIESNEAFYIAKLEQKKTGRVQSFDEEPVQTRIRTTLESEQLGALRERITAQLLKNAIITPEKPNTEPVVEMAMQKYRDWANAK